MLKILLKVRYLKIILKQIKFINLKNFLVKTGLFIHIKKIYKEKFFIVGKKKHSVKVLKVNLVLKVKNKLLEEKTVHLHLQQITYIIFPHLIHLNFI